MLSSWRFFVQLSGTFSRDRLMTAARAGEGLRGPVFQRVPDLWNFSPGSGYCGCRIGKMAKSIYPLSPFLFPIIVFFASFFFLFFFFPAPELDVFRRRRDRNGDRGNHLFLRFFRISFCPFSFRTWFFFPRRNSQTEDFLPWTVVPLLYFRVGAF